MISGKFTIRENNIDKERREIQLTDFNLNKYSVKIDSKLNEIFKKLQNSRQTVLRNLKINKFCEQLKFEGGGGGGGVLVGGSSQLSLSLLPVRVIIILIIIVSSSLLLLVTTNLKIQQKTISTQIKGPGKILSIIPKENILSSSIPLLFVLLQQSSEKNVGSICQKETNILVLKKENCAIAIALIFSTVAAAAAAIPSSSSSSSSATGAITTNASTTDTHHHHHQQIELNSSIKIRFNNNSNIIMQIFKIKFGLPLIGWRVKPEPGD